MTIVIINGLDEHVSEAVATEIRWLRAERERLHDSLCERSAQLVDAERRASQSDDGAAARESFIKGIPYLQARNTLSVMIRGSQVNAGELEDAKRRALNLFDAWNQCTGALEPGSSYWYEMQGVIEDAVHCGAQAATGDFKRLDNEEGPIAGFKANPQGKP